jgi:ATP-binding cassette subfamily F protein uup
MVRGQSRHVAGYLRDFLFDDAQGRAPVKALSGGERNRLLLAKILAQPSNLLILDEPTNDLDMDTLDLLQEMLADYDGTLLLVSHDRDFLDRLVTSVVAVEGQGRVAEYVGGYSDYLRQRPPPAPVKPGKPAATGGVALPPAAKAPRPQRLSYKDQRELDLLPDRLAALEAEIAALQARLADAGLYGRDPAGFDQATARFGAAQAELARAEERWLELESHREALDSAKGL